MREHVVISFSVWNRGLSFHHLRQGSPLASVTTEGMCGSRKEVSPSFCTSPIVDHAFNKGSSNFSMVSTTSFSGTGFPLAESCLLDGVAFCFVTARRGAKLSVQHVMVFLPFVSVWFPPRCQEQQYPNSSHDRPRDDAEGESSTNFT